MRGVKPRWEQRKLGVWVGGDGDKYLTNLRFADDIVLIATSRDDIVTMLRDMGLASTEVGLKLHPVKTKMLSNVAERRGDLAAAKVLVGDVWVEVLGYECGAEYLGRILNFSAYQD